MSRNRSKWSAAVVASALIIPAGFTGCDNTEPPKPGGTLDKLEKGAKKAEEKVGEVAKKVEDKVVDTTKKVEAAAGKEMKKMGESLEKAGTKPAAPAAPKAP